MGEACSSEFVRIDYAKEDLDYDSTNEDDEDTRKAKRARKDLAEKPRQDRNKKGDMSVFTSEQSAEEGRRQRYQLSKLDRKSTRLNSSHSQQSRMPSSA